MQIVNCSVCNYLFAETDSANNAYSGRPEAKPTSCKCGAQGEIVVCEGCAGESYPSNSSTKVCIDCLLKAMKRHAERGKVRVEPRRYVPPARSGDQQIKDMLENPNLLTCLWVTAMAGAVLYFSVPAAFNGGFDRFMPRFLAYALGAVLAVVVPISVLSLWRVWLDRN